MNGEQSYAVILALATALVAGVIGSFALMKRMTLAGDVVSHLTLPGLGLAFLWHINPLLGAAVSLAIGIVVIDRLQRRTGLATETAIGVVFVAGLAIGTLLTPQEDLIDALFGGFAPLSLGGFVLGLTGCVVVGSVVFLLRDRLILIIFSPDVAKSLGVDVERVNFIYLCAFGVTILLGLQHLGALLVGAIIIIPATVGRHLARTLNQFLLFSAVAGMTSVALGFTIGSYWSLPTGPAIVCVASALFGLTLLKK
jgi:ABC-type Mn2+/Zn2+ transport system permease subunit